MKRAKRRKAWGGAYWEFLQEMRAVPPSERPMFYRTFARVVRNAQNWHAHLWGAFREEIVFDRRGNRGG